MLNNVKENDAVTRRYAFFLCPHCLKAEDKESLKIDNFEIPNTLYFNQKIMFADSASKTFKSKPIGIVTNWKYNHCTIYHKTEQSLNLGGEPVTSENCLQFYMYRNFLTPGSRRSKKIRRKQRR